MDFLFDDCKSLLEQVNLQEKELRNKRRWLIGLPTSRSGFWNSNGSNFQIERPIPEYLLREDDVSYETIKSFVEKVVGGSSSKNEDHICQDMLLFHPPVDMTSLFYLIDDMTNQGLLRFAEVLTGGLTNFEETRWKMKQVIKGCLSEMYPKQSNTRQIHLSETHSSLLKNPHNFRWSGESRFIPNSDSCHAAVHNVLDVLETLPTQTLCAMHRKLRGIKGYTPQLIPKKSGWGRDLLIKHVRKKCFGLLSKLQQGDSLQEPLAKAMEVAGLTLKLIQRRHYVTNFRQFSPEINILQNEIALAIQLLDLRVKISVLKNIQVLLDPKAKLIDRKLRSSIRNVLMEYLFECGDMDSVPQCLLEVLATIKNKVYRKHLPKMKIEEEVECILSLSASTKQVLWDMIPDHEFDLEFADAYMEDHEESDGDACEDIELEKLIQNNVSISGTSEVGSSGKIIPVNFVSVEDSKCMAESSSNESRSFLEVPVSRDIHATQYHLVSLGSTEPMNTDFLADTNNRNSFPLFSSDGNSIGGERQSHISETNAVVSSVERNLMVDNQSMCKNQYLAVQAASDEASMLVYRLIGRMLDDFAQKEGRELKSYDLSYLGAGSYDLKRKNVRERKDSATQKEDSCSVIVNAVEELIPSFAKCEADRLKELMGSADQ